jgi:hypothetical protein
LDTFGYARGPAAGAIFDPVQGKIQFPVQQNIAPIAGITKEHTNLAVLDPSCGAAVLPLNPGGMDTLLQKSSLVQYQDRIRAT